jgi:catabolite regulation protein CreA
MPKMYSISITDEDSVKVAEALTDEKRLSKTVTMLLKRNNIVISAVRDPEIKVKCSFCERVASWWLEADRRTEHITGKHIASRIPACLSCTAAVNYYIDFE